MRKVFILLLIATFAATFSGTAFAHGGKSHQLLGTVKLLHENHLVVTTQDGKEKAVTLAGTTQYEKDKKAAKRSDLVTGARVSIQLTEDDKTAVKVKIGAAPLPAQVVDPVCGMKIDPKTAAGSSTHAGKTYWFCSKDEKAKFDKDPGAYLKKE
ncbi:MAG: YHS domain-containing protein [Thermoanaerobaculia bacterium]